MRTINAESKRAFQLLSRCVRNTIPNGKDSLGSFFLGGSPLLAFLFRFALCALMLASLVPAGGSDSGSAARDAATTDSHAEPGSFVSRSKSRTEARL